MATAQTPATSTASVKAPRYVAYLRVSTVKQGASGLGIEAQRQAVSAYVRGAGEGAVVLAEYVETESGKRNDRPKLAEAMEHCRLAGARLLIAKLDRLSRNAAFLISLRDTGIDFVAADMPQADRFTVGILALVAERERDMISERTRSALQAAKARVAQTGQKVHPGVKRLGNPNGAEHLKGLGNAAAIEGKRQAAAERAEPFRRAVAALKAEGVTTAQGIARAFNERGFAAPRGGRWNATGVQRLIARLGQVMQPN
jgi:DNA invertase Pin-like site-specific DNA recombinase